jgi:NDP-sugar pyrophosphorylase family protein
MKPELLVMAAGMGSRYGGLKQLEQVGPSRETVMDYSLFDAHRAGIGRVVFVIRRELEQAFRDRIGDRYTRWMEVDYAFQDLDDLPSGFQRPAERQKPWGTAHAVLAARNAMRAPFLVVNADDFYGRNAFQQLATWASQPAAEAVPSYAMVAFRLANTLSEHGSVARGICRVSGTGRLETVREWVSLRRENEGIFGTDEVGGIHAFRGEEPVSMNCWGFHPSLFPELADRFASFLAVHGNDPKAEFFLPQVIDTLLKEGKCSIQVLESPDRWFGVTYQQDKAMVEAELLSLVGAGAYPRDLWAEGGAR